MLCSVGSFLLPGKALQLAKCPIAPLRLISTTPPLAKRRAGKYRSTMDRSRMLTYEMARRPWHIAVSKSWTTWHTQNLEGFRQQQGVTVAQDEVIRRMLRGLLHSYLAINDTQLVIKRRGNVVYVTGFLHYGRFLETRKIYWLFGFSEEILSNLLKQPVKLELQFVKNEEELAYNYI